MRNVDIAGAIGRHERIGFQFSGGRDSLCALFLLRPYWDRMTVYHLRSGDGFPETQKLVREVAAQVPHFVLIDGRSRETREEFGNPTDLLPHSATPMGYVLDGAPVPMIHRYECCFRSLLQPMFERIKQDGVTLLIRGQRATDTANPLVRSGDVDGGIELLFPIQDWTAEQVMLSLGAMGVSPTPFYAAGMDSTPECMTCTAWWRDGRAAYLAKHHPKQYRIYQEKLGDVANALSPHVALLERELASQDGSRA